MRKNYLLLLMPLLFAACQPKPTTDATTVTSPTPDYPYTIKYPDNWVADTSHTNTMVALSALKDFEKMDTTSMKKYFADSITFNYDGGTFKGTNSQFAKLTSYPKEVSMKIDVKDWEAVVGKEGKKEEWVTVWYTQHSTNAKGKTDSVQYVDDVMFKNGKIVKIDEYTRNFKKK